ncbi:MAG TPA: hypothetical protein VN654_26105 [Vicinamibacterales bacterium]|nr:hypothetical protein [Vicinamibacterales bacterium]
MNVIDVARQTPWSAARRCGNNCSRLDIYRKFFAPEVTRLTGYLARLVEEERMCVGLRISRGRAT